MKFEELKNSLKTRISTAYLLVGVDEYLLNTAYNLIIKYGQIEVLDLNLIKFGEGVVDCDDIVRALDTMPVFSEKKLVYLDARMIKKTEIKNIKSLTTYLKNPNPQSILVINAGDNLEAVGIEKNLFEMVDCNRLDYKYIYLKIKTFFENNKKKITDNVIKLLSDYTLGDLSKILIESEKILSYVGDREEITISDIENIVTRSIEYQIFELTDALSKKNSSKVFEIINDLRAKKDEYKILPSLIYSHFRRLFQVSLNKNLSNAELSMLLGVKEYAVKMTQMQVKLFSKSSLKKINELCIKFDFDLKQSNITIDNAINILVLQILNM